MMSRINIHTLQYKNLQIKEIYLMGAASEVFIITYVGSEA
jgi:hypothetical protein